MGKNRDYQPYTPTERTSIQPRQPLQRALPVAARDDPSHSLHGTYRKKMRGVRLRWFISGMLIGAISGILVTLGLSILAVTSVPGVVQSFTGQPDVSVAINEGYLNRKAAGRVNGSYPTGIEGVTLTSIALDLQEGNRMDLRPVFRVDAFFLQFDVNAVVMNDLSVKDDKLALAMVGDPQLGNFDVPLGLLPFDLNKTITDAVNRVNNEVLAVELNESIQGSFNGSEFTIETVTTTDTEMVVGMKEP
ncbi:MAG: hypothetical protein ABIO92_07915 [Chloroflexia bacterium]